jgi:Ca-activated chloride channel family protein
LALDTSSSLYGPAMAQARAVAASVIDDLDDDESFQLVTFSDSVRTFADSPVRATSANLRRAERYLDDLRALGTTSMTEGLATALSQEPGPSNGLDMVVLVTDGYIASEAELLRLVQERLGDRRLFVIGVGPAPNRFLLERLAEVGRGALLVVSPGDEPSVVAQEFVERIADPQVTDLEIDWGELTVHSVYPRRLPDLFAGQPLLVHGRYDETGNGEAILRGRIGGRAWSERIQMTLDQGGSGNEAMAPIWARAAVHDGMNRLYLRDDEAAREMVTRLGLDFGLVTRFTSFVAVDDAALEAAEQASGEPAEAAVPQTPAPDLMAQASESGATDGPMPVYEPSMAVEAPMPSPPPPAAMPMGGGDLDSLLNSAVGGGGGARAPTKAAGTPGAAALARRLNSEAQPQGLSRVQIQSVIARHLPELRAAAARHGDVHGSVSIRFVVSSDGRVVSAEVDRSTLGGGPAERAILDIFRRMLFPSFAGPNVTVSYPINV